MGEEGAEVRRRVKLKNREEKTEVWLRERRSGFLFVSSPVSENTPRYRLAA